MLIDKVQTLVEIWRRTNADHLLAISKAEGWNKGYHHGSHDTLSGVIEDLQAQINEERARMKAEADEPDIYYTDGLYGGRRP